MRDTLNGLTVDTRVGDIAATHADAIVNAANTELLLGSGVAGALGIAAGPSLEQALEGLGPIALGSAVSTSAGNLPARYVIHAATMNLGQFSSPAVVTLAIRNALNLAGTLNCRTVAMPALGAGFGGVKQDEAAKIMFEELMRHSAQRQNPLAVLLVLTDITLPVFDQRFVWWLKRTRCTCNSGLDNHAYWCPSERIKLPRPAA